MKFAMCNEMFQDWEIEKVCDFLARSGYQGIEIAPFVFAPGADQITSDMRRRILRAAQNAGLQITGLHWLLARTEGYHLTSFDDETRKRTLAYFQELIRLCADLEGRVMVLGSPMQRNLEPDMSLDVVLDRTTDFFQKLVPLLEETSTVIGLEPLTPQETNFLTQARQAVDLADRIGAPEQVAIILDCKAMSGGENISPAETIRKFTGRFVHIHANDPNLQGPGFGDLDFEPIFKALHDVRYDGWVSVEAFDYSPGVERLTVESMEYMKRMNEKALNS